MQKTWAKVGAASIALGVLTLRLMQVGAAGCSDPSRVGKDPAPPAVPPSTETTTTSAAAAEGAPSSSAAGDSEDNPRFFPASKAAPMYYPQPKKPNDAPAPQTAPPQGKAP